MQWRRTRFDPPRCTHTHRHPLPHAHPDATAQLKEVTAPAVLANVASPTAASTREDQEHSTANVPPSQQPTHEHAASQPPASSSVLRRGAVRSHELTFHSTHHVPGQYASVTTHMGNDYVTDGWTRPHPSASVRPVRRPVQPGPSTHVRVGPVRRRDLFFRTSLTYTCSCRPRLIQLTKCTGCALLSSHMLW